MTPTSPKAEAERLAIEAYPEDPNLSSFGKGQVALARHVYARGYEAGYSAASSRSKVDRIEAWEEALRYVADLYSKEEPKMWGLGIIHSLKAKYLPPTEQP